MKNNLASNCSSKKKMGGGEIKQTSVGKAGKESFLLRSFFPPMIQELTPRHREREYGIRAANGPALRLMPIPGISQQEKWYGMVTWAVRFAELPLRPATL
jgi:hypothetical protein